MPGKTWTNKELDILKNIYPKKNKEEILESLLDRTWSAIQHRARRCRLETRNKGPEKLTIKAIKDRIKDSTVGYALLSKKYEGSAMKLMWQCPKGHKFFMSWDAFRNGQRYPICKGINAGNRCRPDTKHIKKYIEQFGHILLTNEYKNAHTKMNFLCPEKHKFSMRWNSFRNGQRCPICGTKKSKEAQRLDFNYVKQYVVRQGYVVLSKKYENSHIKLDFLCPNSHKFSMTWSCFRQGQRCPICWSINRFGPGSSNWKGGIACEPYCDIWLDKDFKESIKQRDGYKCVNPYCSSKNPNDLTIHHIDYNKKSCGPENLITLCRSCNAKANYDREWHKTWYQAVMYRRYGYTY